MVTEVYDLETLSNLFTYTGYSRWEDKWYQFTIHSLRDESAELYKHLRRDKVMYQVGFNNENFDYPLIHFFLLNYNNYLSNLPPEEITAILYEKAQNIISSTSYTGISDKRKFIKQFDLFRIWHYNNDARRTSLKDLQFAMKMPSIEEMPIHHSVHITSMEQIERVLKYNKHDVMATNMFLDTTLGRTEYPLYKGKDRMALRRSLGDKFKVNCANWDDVKLGEQLFLKLYSEAIGANYYDVRELRTKRDTISLKDCIPFWVDIRSSEFTEFLNDLKSTVIQNGVSSFSKSVIFHKIKFDFGLGGSHGCIKPGVYKSDDKRIIIDLDVASLYPSITKSLGLYPEHLGGEFTEIYSKFITDRLNEKRKPKNERDVVLIEGYKLILNGTYGKSNEATSWLYDTLYTYKITIAGQIFIAMWAERLVEAIPDLEFIQINTDGISIMVKKEDEQLVKQVCDSLTQKTSLEIEYEYYDKMIIRDVNNYIGVYRGSTSEKERIKHKGVFAVDCEYHQDSSMRVVPLAIKNYFVYNIPIKETLQNHNNIYDFCLRLKVNNSSKAFYNSWEDGKIKKEPLQRTTRYYIGNKVGSISVFYNGSSSENRINKGFNSILFNTYFESENYDINYQFYIAECNKIINIVENNQLELF